MIEFNKNPSPTIKEKLAFILNEINTNVEMFQKTQMENLVRSIQENSSIYEVKVGIKNFNLFPKKLLKTRLVNTLSIPKSDNYNINVDIENNMIVLQDKKFEENLIVFADLTHNGIQSINFYNSLMNTVKPYSIFVEQEPFEIYQQNKLNSEKYSFMEYKEKFFHLQEFKNYLNENKSDRNYILKGQDLIYNYKKEIMEIESIIYGALSKNIQVNLFDLNHHEYLNTLIYNTKCQSDFFSNENKNVISILNNLEISAWINLQLLKGCKNCTSFLSRNELDWNPLSLEFVVNKNNLPNTELPLLLKTKKIYRKIEENKNKKYIIFSSDTLNLTKKFIEFSNKNSIEKIEGEKLIEDFYKEFIREFSLSPKTLNLEKYFDIITSGLLLKEKFHIYSKNPPIKIKTTEETDFIEFYKKNFLKNFDAFFNLELADELNFEEDKENNEGFVLNKNEKSFIKYNDCSPYNYFQSLKEIRKNML